MNRRPLITILAALFVATACADDGAPVLVTLALPLEATPVEGLTSLDDDHGAFDLPSVGLYLAVEVIVDDEAGTAHLWPSSLDQLDDEAFVDVELEAKGVATIAATLMTYDTTEGAVVYQGTSDPLDLVGKSGQIDVDVEVTALATGTISLSGEPPDEIAAVRLEDQTTGVLLLSIPVTAGEAVSLPAPVERPLTIAAVDGEGTRAVVAEDVTIATEGEDVPVDVW